jgi:hypothetical protein
MNTIGGGALLSVSTYLRRIRDVTQSRLFQQDGVWVEAPFNDGNARAHGVELEAKLPLTKRSTCAPTCRATGRAWTMCRGRTTGWKTRRRPPPTSAPTIAGRDLRWAAT